MAKPRLFSSGAFGGLGGSITVEYDIVPDPETIASQLMTAAAELEDTMKPMLAAREIAREDIQAHFDTETDPDGNSWKPLDPEYRDYKESLGYPDQILQRTTDMMKAATSRAAFTVTPVGLWFNWDALPRDKDGKIYGKMHQAGSSGSSTFQVKNALGEYEEMTLLGGGSGNNLPARPFVGASVDAEAAFWDVFDKWFDEATDVVIHPKTGVMQARGAGGRFGKRLN